MVERYHRTLNSTVGKIIRDDQRNWCEKVPIAAAAYRASVHGATGYSLNRLMLNREVYASIDLVAGLPPGDPEHYESADDFVVQQQRMTRDVYASVREHLQVAASRRIRYYDIRVKDREFQPGMSVLPPSNAVLQKSKKSSPFVAHFDKLKVFHCTAPAEWGPTTTRIADNISAERPPSDEHQPTEDVQPTLVPADSPSTERDVQQSSDDQPASPRLRRCRPRPKRFDDYHMH